MARRFEEVVEQRCEKIVVSVVSTAVCGTSVQQLYAGIVVYADAELIRMLSR